MTVELAVGLASLAGLYLAAVILNHGLWNAVDAMALWLHREALRGRARQNQKASTLSAEWTNSV